MAVHVCVQPAGDVLGLRDASGTLVVQYRYDAWGKQISKSGTLASTLGTANPFRYRGYIYDEEIELYYLQTRYYSPYRGRYISPDSLLGKVGAQLQHNLFCYCWNKPIGLVDNAGRTPELAVTWASSMWWLMAADLPLPVGDAVYFTLLLVFSVESVGSISSIIYQTDMRSIETQQGEIPNTLLLDEKTVAYKRIAKRKHFSSRKKAEEAARRAGRGKPPIHNPHGPHGPHYHPNVPNRVSETPHQPSRHDHYYYPMVIFGGFEYDSDDREKFCAYVYYRDKTK